MKPILSLTIAGMILLTGQAARAQSGADEISTAVESRVPGGIAPPGNLTMLPFPLTLFADLLGVEKSKELRIAELVAMKAAIEQMDPPEDFAERIRWSNYHGDLEIELARLEGRPPEFDVETEGGSTITVVLLIPKEKVEPEDPRKTLRRQQGVALVKMLFCRCKCGVQSCLHLNAFADESCAAADAHEAEAKRIRDALRAAKD